MFHQKIYADEASDIVLLPSTLIVQYFNNNNNNYLCTYCKDGFCRASSFIPRQEVNSATRNIIQFDKKSHIQTKATYNQPLDKSAILQRITYFSDGKTLNATLWMGGVIKHDPSIYGASVVAYGVLIDIDNNNATGKYGVDYQQEIQWNSQTKTWNSILFEYSSPTLFRTLDIRKNLLGLFLHGNLPL